MTKKVDDELADPHFRRITSSLPGVQATKGALDLEWDAFSSSGAWENLTFIVNGIYHEDSIDLSGFANQYLTFFIDSAITQENPLRRLVGVDAAGMIDATLITTVPIDVDTYGLELTSGGSPGLPTVVPGESTELDPSTVIYSRIHVSTADTAATSAIGVLLPVDVGQTGTLEATAADKLFVYRIVVPVRQTTGRDYTFMGAPSQRIILQGTMAEEPTIEYMMRLKRSYELANQV